MVETSPAVRSLFITSSFSLRSDWPARVGRKDPTEGERLDVNTGGARVAQHALETPRIHLGRMNVLPAEVLQPSDPFEHGVFDHPQRSRRVVRRGQEEDAVRF